MAIIYPLYITVNFLTSDFRIFPFAQITDFSTNFLSTPTTTEQHHLLQSWRTTPLPIPLTIPKVS